MPAWETGPFLFIKINREVKASAAAELSIGPACVSRPFLQRAIQQLLNVRPYHFPQTSTSHSMVADRSCKRSAAIFWKADTTHTHHQEGLEFFWQLILRLGNFTLITFGGAKGTVTSTKIFPRKLSRIASRIGP